jgi:hypothetical protein
MGTPTETAFDHSIPDVVTIDHIAATYGIVTELERRADVLRAYFYQCVAKGVTEDGVRPQAIASACGLTAPGVSRILRLRDVPPQKWWEKG